MKLPNYEYQFFLLKCPGIHFKIVEELRGADVRKIERLNNGTLRGVFPTMEAAAKRMAELHALRH